MRLSRVGLIAAVLASASQVGAQTLVRSDSPSRGRSDAPATVVLFCDFQCEHCAAVRTVVDELLSQRPNDVRIVFRHFPLDQIHPQSDDAAEAAACAQEQGRFWEMYASLLTHQQQLDEPGLRAQAREVGLNAPAFDRCLRSGRYTSTWRRDVADGRAAGVSGTPTFFVNGQFVEGVMDTATLDAMVGNALGR